MFEFFHKNVKVFFEVEQLLKNVMHSFNFIPYIVLIFKNKFTENS